MVGGCRSLGTLSTYSNAVFDPNLIQLGLKSQACFLIGDNVPYRIFGTYLPSGPLGGALNSPSSCISRRMALEGIQVLYRRSTTGDAP